MKRNDHKEHRNPCGTAGFSLIEGLVVLTLLGLLAVSIRVGSRNLHAELAAETGVLRGHLRFAQAMAMANNTAVWSLDVTAGAYTLWRDGQPAPLNLPDEPAPGRILPPGVRIVQGLGHHAFNEWGDPGQDVIIVLSDGQHQQQVSILGFTGLIP